MNTGQIIKSRVEEKFTIIPNEILRSNKLSAKAKGLLCFLLGLPSDWVLYKTTLPEYFKDGKESLNSAWEELEKEGYIVSVRIIDTDSNLSKGWNYMVYQEPVLPETPIKSGGSSESGFPAIRESDIRKPASTKKEDTTKKEFTNSIYLDFLNLVNSLTNHKYRPTKKSETQFNARLKEGWTAEEVAVAVRNAVKVEYHQSTKFRYLTPEFFTRADKLNMYSQNANDSLNDEEKYKALFAKGWKNCDQAEVEWAYDYQHRDEMSYSKYVRTELLGNRGSKKTAAEYDAE